MYRVSLRPPEGNTIQAIQGILSVAGSRGYINCGRPVEGIIFKLLSVNDLQRPIVSV